MTKMIRLKKNDPVRYNGVYYDFTMLDPHKLQNIYDNNPLLRHLFEFVEEEEKTADKPKEEDKLDEFLTTNKPEGKTEEEFFNEIVEEIKKPIRKKK